MNSDDHEEAIKKNRVMRDLFVSYYTGDIATTT